ncbi:Rap/Ran GTPase-activating protein [Entamoeba marina]
MKSQKEQQEKDKKIKKKRLLLLDLKENNQNKMKRLFYLIEEDPEIVEFTKKNHSAVALLMSDYATTQTQHSKKGKLSLKTALSNVKLVEFAGKAFPYSEFHAFKSLITLFESYLSLGTDLALRRPVFETALNLYEHKRDYDPMMARIILAAMNVGVLLDLKSNNPFDTITSEPLIPGQAINEKDVSVEFCNKFFDKFCTKGNFETFLPLAEHLCASSFPSFSKTISLSCVIPSNGLLDIPPQLTLLILEYLKRLLNTEIVPLLFANKNTFPFFEYILGCSLNFSPEMYKTGLDYYEFFVTEFVANSKTAKCFEDVLSPDALLDFRKYVVECIDIPFTNAETNPVIVKFTEALHLQMMDLLKKKIDIPREMKDLIIHTLVNNVGKLVDCYRDDAIGSLIDSIVTLFVYWNHSLNIYDKLYEYLHPYYTSDALLQQLCNKLLHVTMFIIQANPQRPKEKEPSIQFEVEEPDFVFPKEDPTFSKMVEFQQDQMFELWQGLWLMITDTCVEESVKNCCESVRKTCQLLINFGLDQIDLINVFGSYYLRALASSTDADVRVTAGLGLCDLFVRDIRYVTESYSTFYESVIPLIPLTPYDFLLALSSVFSLKLPGCTRLIVPILSMLQQLPDLPSKSHPNLPIKIVGLLNSLIYSERLYPAAFKIIDFQETLGSFSEALYSAQKRLLLIFTSSATQQTILWGLACHVHLLIVQKDTSGLALEILKNILTYLPTDHYRCICQIISTFSRLSPPLPVELIAEIHQTSFSLIPSLTNQTSGLLIMSLLPYLLSPNVSPAVHSIDIGQPLLEGLSTALHMNVTRSDPHRVIAAEAAEAYIGTLIGILGNEMSLHSSTVGDDLNDSQSKWYCSGNSLYSVRSLTNSNNTSDVKIVVRNGCGRFEWTFLECSVPGWKRTIEELEMLGDVPEGNGIVPEKIYSDVNDLSVLLDQIPDEMTWDFPTDLMDPNEFTHQLETTRTESIELRNKLEELPKHKIETSPPSLPEHVDLAISSPLTTGLLLTQLFFIDVLASSSSLISMPCHEKFKNALIGIDKTPSRRVNKIALIYVASGQEDQWEILANSSASKQYVNFTAALGEETDLKEYNGYIGGLDRKFNCDGQSILYYKTHTNEVIFHEVVRMPSVPDENDLVKKKHVGNDNVSIVWNEHTHFYPQTITSGFNCAHLIVNPGPNGVDRVDVWRKQDVGVFGPITNSMVVPEDLLPELLRETAINADYCAASRMNGDEYLFPSIRRKEAIQDLIPKNPTFSQKGYLPTISVMLDNKEVNGKA